MRCHITPTRKVTVKRRITSSAGKDVEKMESPHTAVGIQNAAAAVENSLVALQKSKRAVVT